MATSTTPSRDASPAIERDADGGVPSRQPWLVVGWVIAGALALVPVVRMVGILLDGSALQYNDYWEMLTQFTTDSGGLDVGGLFVFQNEHPVVLPQLVYWLNLQLFSGSNISLGLFVVGLAAGQLGLVVLMLRQTTLPAVQQMVLLVLASALLFDPAGTWNFWKAMSGTAWLTANLLALAAVYLRSRDLRWLAAGAAVLASVSYGTGIAAWLAVLAVGMVRRPWREWWREAPYAVGFVVTYVWYQVASTGAERFPTTVVDIVRASAGVLGAVLGLSGDVAEVVGYLPLVGVPALAVLLLFTSRSPGVAAWVGVATFGWIATIVIAYGRANSPFGFTAPNRYLSLPALTWLGFVVLCFLALDHVGVPATGSRRHRIAEKALRWVPVVAVVPVLLGALTAGQDHVDEMRDTVAGQELWEVAARFQLTRSTSALVALGEPQDVTDLLQEVGHHPFTDDWDLDCGLRGEQLPAADPDATIDGSIASAGRSFQLAGAATVTGYVVTDAEIRCIVVADGSGTVAGAATVGTVPLPPGAPDDATSFSAVAERGLDAYGVYALVEGRDEALFLGEAEL